MTNLIFCVIMPCYNSALYIKDALYSLIHQTYKNWNLIAINDGSTDKTEEILRSYSEKDSRIRIISKENGGYATAVNYGLDNISGDYFLMMGSDDRLSVNLFSEIAKEIDNKQLPDIIAFRTMQYRDGNPYKIDSVTAFETTAYMCNGSINLFCEKYPKHSNIFFERDTSKMYKKSLLGSLRYFGECGYDSDGVFSTLFAHRCKSFLCVPFFGYYWTIRDSSVSASLNNDKNIDRIKVWINYLKSLRKNNIRFTKRDKKYVFMPINIAITLLKNNSKLSFYNSYIINKGVRISLRFALNNQIDLGIYRDIIVKNRIKRNFFLIFPLVWLRRYGYTN